MRTNASGFVNGVKMSNENKEPWYRSSTKIDIIFLIVIIIVVILVIIDFPDTPDFAISVDPDNGTVQASSIIKTTVTIEGKSGYDQIVDLSSSCQSSYIAIDLIPSRIKVTPAYTANDSNISIHVDSDAPAGKYEIIIKGIGSDEEKHSVKYVLTIKSTLVSTTHTSIPTSSSPNLTIKITNPKNGSKIVSNKLPVEGTVTGEIPHDKYMWVIVNRHDDISWRPQTEERYLFSWENVPGNGDEELLGFIRDDLNIGWMYLFNWGNVSENDGDRLKKFLVNDLGIYWGENATIKKSVDSKSINISINANDGNSAEIIIDDKNEKAILKITNGKTYNLKVKKENGKLNIYGPEKLTTDKSNNNTTITIFKEKKNRAKQ